MEKENITKQALTSHRLNGNGQAHQQDNDFSIPDTQYSIPERDICRQQGYSWKIFGQFMLLALLGMTAEFSITHTLIVNDLGIGVGIGAKMEAIMFSIGITLFAVIIKIVYERLVEIFYIQHTKIVRFIITILACVVITFAGIGTFGGLRYESFVTKKIEEYVYQVRDNTNSQLAFQRNMGADEEILNSIKESGSSKELALLHAYDPKINSLEELKVKYLRKDVVKWTFILSGVLIALLSGICFGIANVQYKVLNLRSRIISARNTLSKLTGRIKHETEICEKITSLFDDYNKLLKERTIHLSERAKALTDIYYHLGQQAGNSGFTYEKQDFLLKLYNENC